ncbi:WbqC family protein [Salinactinospora qingdaonensis]|uniref:WbqC family protein n=1 Tax=Salinactinospora qingdaonensis TaxID=702744 RepID=A0ABP7F443_9ACTN
MRVAMHQPHYLPWLGLIDKVDRCDLFIVLDHVQFERKGWQNRNYVASKDGPLLLTAAVVQRSRDERILDKALDDSQPWREKHRRAIAEHCYRAAPYWKDYASSILELYETPWQGLTDLAMASTRLILDAFGIDTPILYSSEMGEFPGQKSELLAQLCAKVGATTMLSGDGARGYVDLEVFRRYGVDVEWQNFQHPEYPQHNRANAEFLPRMAALDMLLNVGPGGIETLRAARSSEVDE